MRACSRTAVTTPDAVSRRGRRPAVTLGFGLVLQYLAATVETVGADVVTQVHFTGGRLNGNAGHVQRVVRAVHAALGRGLFVLLDGHGGLLNSIGSIGVRLGFAYHHIRVHRTPHSEIDTSAKPSIIARRSPCVTFSGGTTPQTGAGAVLLQGRLRRPHRRTAWTPAPDRRRASAPAATPSTAHLPAIHTGWDAAPAATGLLRSRCLLPRPWLRRPRTGTSDPPGAGFPQRPDNAGRSRAPPFPPANEATPQARPPRMSHAKRHAPANGHPADRPRHSRGATRLSGAQTDPSGRPHSRWHRPGQKLARPAGPGSTQCSDSVWRVGT